MDAEEMQLWQTRNTMPEEVPLILPPPSAADPVLAEVVRRLQELYHPEQIYLFGSTARGESGPDSDYDLMVIVADSTPIALRDSGRAYKAIWRLGVATDVLVWTRSDFEERLELKASLPSTIAREGKLLYAA
jgi:predicted nucleotidyltransferase